MPANMKGNLKAAALATGQAATGALRIGTQTVQQGVEVAGQTANAAMTAAKSAAKIAKQTAETAGEIGVSAVNASGKIGVKALETTAKTAVKALDATGKIGVKTLETTATAAVNALETTSIISKKGFEVTAESGSKLIGEAGKVADAATAISGDAVVAVIDTFGLGVGRAKLSLLESKLQQNAKQKVLTEDTVGQYIDQLGIHYNETVNKLLKQLTLQIEGQGLAFETLIAMYKQLNCKKRWYWGYNCNDKSDAKIKQFTSQFLRCHASYKIVITKIENTQTNFNVAIGQFKSTTVNTISTKGRDIESQNFSYFKNLIDQMQSEFDGLFEKMNLAIKEEVDIVVEETAKMKNTEPITTPSINTSSGGRQRTRLRKHTRRHMKRTIKKYNRRS